MNAATQSEADAKRYNGWTNYETWNVALWLGNEEISYRHWRSEAQECWEEATDSPSAYSRVTGKEIWSREERAAFAMADRLKSQIEEEAPELGASMWSDLLSAALSEVNWREIAQHMIDDCDKTEPDEDDDDDDEQEDL